jgi:phosphoribosyl 1,2-cyclic phosphate phosphodiesterase
LLSLDEHRVLIDASTDLRQQALREDLDALHAVLLTHGHADHVFGLDDVRMYNFRQQRSMPIYGGTATLADIRRTFWYVFEPDLTTSSRPQLTLNEVTGPFQIEGFTVIPFAVMHGAMPILGYRVGRFAYITDGSSVPDSALPSLSGLDVLVINALRNKPHPSHFTLSEALDTIARIAPRRAYLTHISHDFDHTALARTLPEGIQPAYDGLTIEVDHRA